MLVNLLVNLSHLSVCIEALPFSQKMPVINVDDLTDKDKALMEVNQLKIEVKLERWLVSWFRSNVIFIIEQSNIAGDVFEAET